MLIVDIKQLSIVSNTTVPLFTSFREATVGTVGKTGA